MALERVGLRDMDLLLREMESWSLGNWLEKRAAAAGLCQPTLLRVEEHAQRSLDILDDITLTIQGAEKRKDEDFKVLRQGLAYCWSVAVVALPDEGKRLMEKWLASPDKDVLWIMTENLKKKRLARMDTAWVTRWKARLGIS
jgi:hypothetical protein